MFSLSTGFLSLSNNCVLYVHYIIETVEIDKIVEALKEDSDIKAIEQRRDMIHGSNVFDNSPNFTIYCNLVDAYIIMLLSISRSSK